MCAGPARHRLRNYHCGRPCMRWTGSFTFIPVLYIACASADNANEHRLGQLDLEVFPYLVCSAIPVTLFYRYPLGDVGRGAPESNARFARACLATVRCRRTASLRFHRLPLKR